MKLMCTYIHRAKHRTRWVDALRLGEQETKRPVPCILINGPADPVSGAHLVQRYRGNAFDFFMKLRSCLSIFVLNQRITEVIGGKNIIVLDDTIGTFSLSLSLSLLSLSLSQTTKSISISIAPQAIIRSVKRHSKQLKTTSASLTTKHLHEMESN